MRSTSAGSDLKAARRLLETVTNDPCAGIARYKPGDGISSDTLPATSHECVHSFAAAAGISTNQSLQSHFYLFIISTQLQSPNTDLIFQYQHIGKLLQTLFGGNTQNAELHGPLRRLHLIV